ncbi:MurT ligase domain-containing protein [Anaerovorax odorimutans]|uniref:Lipid II isoglutaminyl synthase (glutamine-hydrolyzing) subunit MurT n=1 Tax=Anaerovorax odorimutans TaxID=109327 RepID=A0ABT1RMT8_9FIRM|nr:MurT ligase domain-containing protein [Anaerovorax odorimutans]MCQ4636504.1 MurT ligase domain-containing protein [Anaerovorax odorimutans]
MYLRRLVAVWCAHAIRFFCRMCGKQGGTFAGRVALRIDPSILTALAAEVRNHIFIVCGTNGKSTTNTLLASVLEADGGRVICNRTGSNMLSGVVSAFVLGAGAGGHLDADYACLEVDEASAVKVIPHFQPDFMILTNLFRDQMDRYGDIDATMELLSRAIEMAPEMKLLINGDEPLSVYLAQRNQNPMITYGVSQQVQELQDTKEIREGQFCKCCGEKLRYRFYHYGQLGDYCCPKCGFTRPAIDFEGTQVNLSGGLQFNIRDYHIKTGFEDFYSIYNLLAVYSAATLSGADLSEFNKIICSYSPPPGRNETFKIGDTKVMLKLAKNQVGFDQNICAILADQKPKDIIILINDNAQDGTDISWIWDVNFERLHEARAASVTVSGIRCLDMCLRLKYADIPSEPEPEIEAAIQSKVRLKDGTKNLYLLVNYTGLYEAHKILKKMEEKSYEYYNRSFVS